MNFTQTISSHLSDGLSKIKQNTGISVVGFCKACKVCCLAIAIFGLLQAGGEYEPSLGFSTVVLYSLIGVFFLSAGAWFFKIFNNVEKIWSKA